MWVIIICFISDCKWCIILHGCQRFSPGIKCRRIACNDFKSRSRLPAGLCCTVPGTVSRLISTSADNSLYLSGRLIHNRHRHLRLHGNENILWIFYQLVPFPEDIFFVLCNCSPAVLLRCKIDRIILTFVFLFIIGKHCLIGICFYCTILLLHLKRKIEWIFGTRIIIGFVCHLLIADFLDLKILCGLDRQSPLINCLVCFWLRIAFDIYQIIKNIINDRVHKICVHGFFPHIIVFGNPAIHIICHRFIILFLRNISLFFHGIQHILSALCIFLWMKNGIVTCRILCNSGNNRTFRKCQLWHIFPKITLCCCLNPKGIASKVDGIQIIFENPVLVIYLFFQLYCQILFLYFPLYLTFHLFHFGNITVIFVCPLLTQHIIFNQLLRKCTCSLTEISGPDIRHQCPDNSFQVNTVMIIKTLILDRHYRMLQILRNLVNCHVLPVGSGCH